MKKIFIMRHGEAEGMKADDASRNLTQTGLDQADMMGVWLSRNYEIDVALVSPYVRAQQTLNVVKVSQKNIKLIETTQDLTPEALPTLIIDYLETFLDLNAEFDTILLVSHMPLVSYLVGELCPGQMPIFNTAAIACIEYYADTKKNKLVELKSPEY